MGGALFTMFAKLTMDSSEFDKKLGDSQKKAGGFGKALKSGAVVGIKALAGATVAASGALVALGKKSLEAYADTEQLIGGVQKLYGNMGMSLEEYADSVGKSVDDVSDEWNKLEKAQNLVLENAKNAYKTSGMSANEYMETATSFSAALINSLGGDTVAAAKQTDVAMRAIADNFNTFGGDIQSVQAAFQGFAKGQYTLLDNLKLGYGGTKTEMERLIADANEYAKANGMAADLTIDSFSDIVTAIDLIQKKQNIAGTTAREGATTIAGSLMTLKAAWANLVAGFADPDADIAKLVEDVVSSVAAVGSNVLPAIERIFVGIGDALTQAAPQIVEAVPEVFGTIVPPLIQNALTLVTTVAEAVYNSLPGVITTGVPLIMDSARMIITTLADTLKTNVPTLLTSVATIVPSMLATLREGAGQLIDVGLYLIINLVQGLMDNLPTLLEQIPEIVTQILGVITDNSPKLLQAGVDLLLIIGKGIIEAIPTLLSTFAKTLQAIVDSWNTVNWRDLGYRAVKTIISGIKSLASNAPSAIKTIGQNAVKNFKAVNWADAGRQALTLIGNAITAMAGQIPNMLTGIATGAGAAFREIDWYGVGTAVIDGIKNGITSTAYKIANAALDAAKAAFQKVKDFFGISSPSKLFRKEVGQMIGAGMALGITDSEKVVDRSMDALNRSLMYDIGSLTVPEVDVINTGGSESGEGRAVTFYNTFNIDGSDEPEEVAYSIVRELELQLRTV